MRTSVRKRNKNPLCHGKNWEENIRSVVVEPCDTREDPVGYKAIFYLTFEAAAQTKSKSFEIGASFLARRKHNLCKAGYIVPMTVQAIESIENRIGRALPILLDPKGKNASAHGYA